MVFYTLPMSQEIMTLEEIAKCAVTLKSCYILRMNLSLYQKQNIIIVSNSLLDRRNPPI